MSKKKFTRYIVGGGILAVLIIYLITLYNSLVSKEEKIKQQWAEVQNTYQRRLDLIPALVNTVKGVSGFEQETLEKIANARALSGLPDTAINAANFNNQSRLQDSVASAANRIIVVVERYPELKGTEAYAGLQVQLEGTERRIRIARQDFNEAIASYNKKIRSFPANIFAGLFGFRKKEGFEAVAGSDKAIEIKF
jgi:LemA protein